MHHLCKSKVKIIIGVQNMQIIVKCLRLWKALNAAALLVWLAGFSLNGELMMDRMGQEIAFKGIDLSEAYVPIISLGAGQHAKINFGQVLFLACYLWLNPLTSEGHNASNFYVLFYF